ncbi:MAG: universal stress protein [Rhodothermales bacterium]|nr:universal stress protein [Rhodothermales bacterium]
MYSNILVPLDANRQDDYWQKSPLQQAIEIGGAGASIHLMTAIPFHWMHGFYPDIHKHALVKESKAKLEAIMENECPSNIDVDICVDEGGAISSDILKIADELSVDAIVMATHMPMVRDYLLGSHASHVALHAQCSVFVVRTTACSKILVPVDTNYESDEWLEEPLQLACEMAQRFQASMTVVSIIPDLLLRTGNGQLDSVVNRARDKLDAIVAKYCPGDLHIDVNVIQGGICQEILRAVKEQSIDLVIMASHGPVLKDYVIGSNAAYVALHAPCSVFVIRDES